MPVKNRFAELLPEIVAWRHDFHAHPELQYDVQRTAALVAELLREFGLDEVIEGIGKTGVVGVIRGRSDSTSQVIGLRADMDALPIHEATGVEYASQIPGKMHACGHDGHMAMLLGAAKYLAGTRNFDGTAIVIFQPAEEGGAGGQAMIEDGLADRWNIQEFYGLHNMPGLPIGHFAIREGRIMAAADEFEIIVNGKGGHAASPNDCVDTLLVASQIIVSMQSVVARNIDPLKSGVVSCCVVETDSTAHNVIPQTVRILGTARSLDPDVREVQAQAIRRIAESTATALGARAELCYRCGYPVTSNHPEPTRHAVKAARSISAGVNDNVAPMMAGEDFSFMLNTRPGAYIFLGNGDSAMLHHPEYDFNDEAIPFGSSWLVSIIETRMPVDPS
ncbi:MAG: M20 aminoacylase family protein [Paracoccus sp. (in: a-proteobacteria)]